MLIRIAHVRSLDDDPKSSLGRPSNINGGSSASTYPNFLPPGHPEPSKKQELFSRNLERPPAQISDRHNVTNHHTNRAALHIHNSGRLERGRQVRLMQEKAGTGNCSMWRAGFLHNAERWCTGGLILTLYLTPGYIPHILQVTKSKGPTLSQAVERFDKARSPDKFVVPRAVAAAVNFGVCLHNLERAKLCLKCGGDS
jgi:hypothetical protein